MACYTHEMEDTDATVAEPIRIQNKCLVAPHPSANNNPWYSDVVNSELLYGEGRLYLRNIGKIPDSTPLSMSNPSV